MNSLAAQPDPMTQVLATFRRQEATDWGNAWVGMEPTFQTKKSVRKWGKMAAKEGGEDAYFTCSYMLKTQKKVAEAVQKKYEAKRKAGTHPSCMFARVKLDDDLDQWQVRRQNLLFHWPDDQFEPFEVRFTLDPETFEYSIKPVPLAWFYDERFVNFLEEFLWQVPRDQGLTPSIAHGGAQFSLSAKTLMVGSLLADDIAYKLNHPELANWIMDWPNPDDRAFRATRSRFQAFREILHHYWAGGFHPQAIGVLTAENAYLDRGFGPASSPPQGLMSDQGPLGQAREVFQTNFAFGRAVRLQAQNVHPGYWQSAHPDEDGYRPDQIMRYSEGNLNRLQIAGEYHVKSGKVLDPEEVPELDAPLELALLTEECSWENRGQMSRTSARDFVEALLLDVHHAQYLQAHPHVSVKDSDPPGSAPGRCGNDRPAPRRRGDAGPPASGGPAAQPRGFARAYQERLDRARDAVLGRLESAPRGRESRHRPRGRGRLRGESGAGGDDGPAAGIPARPDGMAPTPHPSGTVAGAGSRRHAPHPVHSPRGNGPGGARSRGPGTGGVAGEKGRVPGTPADLLAGGLDSTLGAGMTVGVSAQGK